MSVKVTYQLSRETVERVRQQVAAGHASSLSEFVELALSERLERLRREDIREQIAAAGHDPLYIADVRDITSAYETSIEDGLEDPGS